MMLPSLGRALGEDLRTEALSRAMRATSTNSGLTVHALQTRDLNCIVPYSSGASPAHAAGSPLPAVTHPMAGLLERRARYARADRADRAREHGAGAAAFTPPREEDKLRRLERRAMAARRAGRLSRSSSRADVVSRPLPTVSPKAAETFGVPGRSIVPAPYPIALTTIEGHRAAGCPSVVRIAAPVGVTSSARTPVSTTGKPRSSSAVPGPGTGIRPCAVSTKPPPSGSAET